MKKNKFLYSTLFLIMLLGMMKFSVAQKNEPLIIKNEYNNLKTHDFFDKIETNYDIRFFYIENDSLPNIKINFTNDTNSIYSILKNNFSPYNIKVFREQNNFFLLKDKKLKTNLADNFFKSSQKKLPDKKPSYPDTIDNQYIKTYNDKINNYIVIGNNNGNKKKKKLK